MQWRRSIGWTLAVLGTLLLAGAAGGYLFLRSRTFQEYALRKIVDETTEATGARAEIRALDFQPSTLTAHLYNITLHGKERTGQLPLLQIDKLTVGLTIQSWARRKVTLRELLVEHPVAHLAIDREGNSNVPQAPSSPSNSHTSIFDLAIGHVQVTNGEIYYRDRKTPLDADLYNLGTETRFDPVAARYSGKISYDNGHVRYARYSPLPHSLKARFNATPSALSLESLELKVGSSAISLRASLADYSNPAMEGNYDIRIHAPDFAAMSPSVTPTGDVSLTGTMHYRAGSGQPLLRAISIDGRISSEALAATSSAARLDFRRLRGEYRVTNGAFYAHKVDAELLGGQVSVDGEIRHLDSTPVSRVRTLLQGISMQAAQQAIRKSELKEKGIELSGRLDGTVVAKWTGGGMNTLSAVSDLNLRSKATLGANVKTNASRKVLPVDGSIHVSYDGGHDTIAFRQTTLRVSSTTLTLQGEISKHSNLQVKANASDLHQMAALASALSPSQLSKFEISGSAELNAAVQGSMQRPNLAGQLSAQNLQVQGSRWSSAQLKVRANSSQIVLENGSLVNAHQGKASFSANLTLRNWAYIPSDPIAFSISAQRMSVTDLQHLANQQYPVSGDLSADISFHGSQLDPAGSGSVKILNARVYDEPFQNLEVKFHGDRGSIASTMDVSLPAGSATASLTYTPKTKAYDFRLNAPSVVLQKLSVVKTKNLALTGTLTASASGQGTLDNPQLTAAMELPQLQLRQNSISQLKVEVHVAHQRADLALSSQVAKTSVGMRAQVNLTGDYYAEAAIDTGNVALDPVLAMYLPSVPDGFQGETELHATLKGPLKNKSQVEAHLTIPRLNASYQSLQIGAAGPIRADYSHSVITLQPAEIRGTGTSVRIQGSIPLDGRTAPNLTAQGSIDLHVLRILAPDLRSAGTVALDVHASGAANSPSLQGQVHLQDVALTTPDAPIGVDKLNGTLDIANDKIRISSLTGQAGGGQVSVGGSIVYRPSFQFDIALQGKSIRLRYPEGLRALLDGSLSFTGTTQASTLNGRVLIDSLSFTPDFDLAKFGDQFGGSAAPAQPGFADSVKLAIAVQTKDNLSATSSQVSVEGQANLQVTGTTANPVIIGRTNLTSGELFYRNVRYQLQGGIISFENPTATEPVMNVSVTTTVEQYNLTLTLKGPFDKLTTSYISDPSLSTADIINLIARGKTVQESNTSSQSTDSMIASQAASQASGSLQKLAGISSLQIDPVLGGNNQNPSARVAIQQRVSKNFLFTFSTDVSQPGAETVGGEYQINKRWSVSASRDPLGGVSVDGRFHTKF
jgi:translocation and assembly module TamB